MRATWRFLRRSKRRMAVATVIAVLVPAGAAMAYYILVLSGSGSTSGTLGTQSTQAATVTVQAALTGLKPGDSVPYTVKATIPTTGSQATIQAAPTMQVTTGGGCQATWFSTTAGSTTYPVSVANDGQPYTVGSGTIKFDDSGTDQSACAGQSITLKATTP